MRVSGVVWSARAVRAAWRSEARVRKCADYYLLLTLRRYLSHSECGNSCKLVDRRFIGGFCSCRYPCPQMKFLRHVRHMLFCVSVDR